MNDITQLITLSNEVTFRNSDSIRRRMGVNGANALSIYETAKWYSFKRTQRELFRSCFPQEILDKAFIGWFLRIPEDGFIDRIETWVNKDPGRVCYYSIALGDGQQIKVDGRDRTFNFGDVFHEQIRTPYEIVKGSGPQLWACLLTMNTAS